MNTRRFVLHLIIGLLTFLIGVTAAIALGGFNPLERFDRSYSRHHYTIPPQPLIDESSTMTERSRSYPTARTRTADLRYRLELNAPPAPPVAPTAPPAPFADDEAAPPPQPRESRRRY
jgi:hypothetical protein